ncbi:hypothetical protein BXZ70DRAFT_893558 [Cristinia sonorae]|uniref:Amidohydrolase-related domain-containing protein n=1 Tax=Cristinia sonorae TaxID=1940300 RepID=A0A8K0XPQ6_9AGAR|nr:hypothetical protein BXZ70DRAFT_893558 [Cristinia sonorae]
MEDNKGGKFASFLPVQRTSKPSRFRGILGAILTVAFFASITTIFSPERWQATDGNSILLKDVGKSYVPDDPAREWKDDVWPIRPQTPWDISTDYPYPRKLEYDVTEGTWLRLDVHPKTGEIVFDMLGDIYCLPAHAYSQVQLTSGSPTKAVPILLGVPHDSDPHFSPNGDRIVFRSDAGLGIENIWVLNYTSCEQMDLRSPHGSVTLLDALNLQEAEEKLLAEGLKETEERRQRRMIREGRHGAQRVTNETYRWVSDARFHPSGATVIATKWHTTYGRSLGAGEGWEYPVPSSDGHIESGAGKRVVSRSLPFGWSPEQYEGQQVGPEQLIWHGEDTLIYAKNVMDASGQFSYSKDVHTGIYAIFSTNLTSKETTTLVSSYPGGASRPELSRDGRTLAFVRRVRDKEALVLKDLVTGTIHHIWHGLTYDLSAVSAPMGTYPSFAFTPDDEAVIIWAAGQIYHVPLTTNPVGEKVKGREPLPIRFQAHIEKRIAETLSPQTDILALETQDSQRVHALRQLQVNHDGSKVVFQAAGVNYVHEIGHQKKANPKRVPTLTDLPYYSPSFVPHVDDLVLHARWSNTNFSTFELANLVSGKAWELTGLPLGRYYSPVLCESKSDRKSIAFIKTDGDYLTGDIVATAKPGLYLGTITPSKLTDNTRHIPVEEVQFVTDDILGDDVATTKIRFIEKNTKLLVQQSREAYIIDLGAGSDELGKFKHHTLATGAMSSELAAVVSENHKKASYVAFVDFFNVYIAPNVKAEDAVWSKPGKATKGLARVGLDGGHDVVFSGDGKTLFWLLGPFIHFIEISKIQSCSSQIRKDQLNFGISCTRHLLSYQELIITHSTDIHRLKAEARTASLHEDEVAIANADYLVIYNATLLTMDGEGPKTDLLHDSLLVVRDGKIMAILGVYDAVIPYGATSIDAQGGYVIPGFIDVHAHWDGFSSPYPARSWELETFLAYGVTTLHNPSSSNVAGFWERSRVERGQTVGPRIFSVGDIIFGAGADVHQSIGSMEEAHSALTRIKAEGGPASFSYKNYNLPSRASRQRLLLAARNLPMLCVPEGGMNYDWDQTYIVDGMTTVEHPLPVPILYEDVMTLFALSGTGSTPTHIVNYGGVWGEQYVWATEDVPNDPKLRRFTRHDILEGLSESTTRPKNSYALFNTSETTAKMVHKGLKAHIGAHGEPPLGLNYHAEMFFTQQGGLNNYEVIRAATSDAAKTLGIYRSLGSLTPGKLADFLVYPPGVDILNGDIKGTRDIKYVVRGGRVWDASTMVEVWPVKGKREPLPPLNPE